jgi:hypothetical protein
MQRSMMLSIFCMILCSCNIFNNKKDSASTGLVLSGFSAVTGLGSPGDIILNFKFPEEASEFGKVDVIRLEGLESPNSDCKSNGEKVLTIDLFTDMSYTDSTGKSGERFSYIACVFDKEDNIASVKLAVGIKSKSKTETARILVTSKGLMKYAQI